MNKLDPKPKGFKLSKDDVWGKFDEKTHKRLTKGMIVARGYPSVGGYFTQQEYNELVKEMPDICPVWKDRIPYKSVTAICTKEQVNEVIHWLAYVHGGEYSKTKNLPDNKIAIRSDYQCW